jgi:carboxyl-terminal processing protease
MASSLEEGTVKRVLVLVVAGLLLLCSAAGADVVTLRNGDRVSGTVVKEAEDSVTIETGFGTLTIPRSDIAGIEKVAPERRDYLRRVEELARKHRELAKWCRERELEDGAGENAEAALELENILAAAREPASRAAGGVDLKVFDAAWEAVRDKFFDTQTYNGCDWEAMRGKYLPKAKAAKTQGELYDVINAMLAELKASHCYLWSPYIWNDHVRNEFRGETTLQAGIEIIRLGEEYFVRGVYHGGPADKAGAKVGDELVSVNGEEAARSGRMVLKDGISTDRRALYTLRTDDGGELKLGLRREKDGEVVEVSVKPEQYSMLEAAKSSIEVVQTEGRKLGYIHLWHFMNRGMVSVLRDALSEDFKDCDGLVLDVRGRGGSAEVIDDALRAFMRGRWAKPAVLVTDGDTSSAKEIFAYHWKKYKFGPVVGRRTAGHVLGSGMIPMPDGSMLLLARVKVTRMTDNIDLEGRGVAPDIVVRENSRYCAGKHPIVEKAFEVLLQRVKDGTTGEPKIERPERQRRAG